MVLKLMCWQHMKCHLLAKCCARCIFKQQSRWINQPSAAGYGIIVQYRAKSTALRKVLLLRHHCWSLAALTEEGSGFNCSADRCSMKWILTFQNQSAESTYSQVFYWLNITSTSFEDQIFTSLTAQTLKERPPGDSREGEEHLHFLGVWRGNPILPPLLLALQSIFWVKSSAFQILPDLYSSLGRTWTDGFFMLCGLLEWCLQAAVGTEEFMAVGEVLPCDTRARVFSFFILQKTKLRENRFFSRAMSPKARLEPVCPSCLTVQFLSPQRRTARCCVMHRTRTWDLLCTQLVCILKC